MWLHRFDKDASGFISKDELREVLTSLGQAPTDETLRDLMEEMDINRSGEIDFGEFCAMMVLKTKNTDEDEESRVGVVYDPKTALISEK